MVIKTRIRRATEQHRSNFSSDNQDHDQSFPAAIVYSDQLCYWCLSLSPQLKFCQFEPGEETMACFCSRLFVLWLVKSNLSSELYTSLFIYMKLARLGCQATSHKKHTQKNPCMAPEFDWCSSHLSRQPIAAAERRTARKWPGDSERGVTC